MRGISLLVLGLTCLQSSAFIFGVFREQLKAELLSLSSETKKGVDATSIQEEKIMSLFERLEKLNPTKNPLKSDLVNGVWSLEYTTSASISGKNSNFDKVGPILQTIDVKNLFAENSEIVNYFGFKVPQKVTAELTPQNNQFTNVQFKKFFLGPFSFDAPEKFKGSLDVTYLDDELRLTRGDKGNIFVLTRMK